MRKNTVIFLIVAAVLAGGVLLLYASSDDNRQDEMDSAQNTTISAEAERAEVPKLPEGCPKPVRLTERTEHGTRVLREHAYPEGIEVIYLHILPLASPVNYQYNSLSKDRWLEITKKIAEIRKIFHSQIEHYTRHADYESKLYALLQVDVLLPLIKDAIRANILPCLPQKSDEYLPDIVVLDHPFHDAVQDKNALTISVGASLGSTRRGDPFRPNVWSVIRIRAYQYTPMWDNFLPQLPLHPRYEGRPPYYYLDGVEYLSRPNSHYIGAFTTSEPYPIPIDTTEVIEVLIQNVFQSDLTLMINRIR